MKQLLFSLVALMLWVMCRAQTTKADSIIDRTNQQLKEDIKDEDALVSEYTFRNLVKNDFSRIITGDKNKTAVGRYAALDLNTEDKRFTFVPITYSLGNNSLLAPFRHVVSLEISGALSSKNSFNFKDRNSITSGVAYTYVRGTYSFDSKNKQNISSKYEAIYNQAATEAKSTLDKHGDAITELKNSKALSNPNEIKKAFLDKVEEAEILLTDKLWNHKKIWWVKTNINFFSLDNFDYINIKDSSTYFKPASKSVYNPSFQISGNLFYSYRNGVDLYLNGYAKGARKHTLSEIASKTEWNKIKRFNDTLYFASDEKDVFVFDDSQFSTKFLADFGLQFICIVPFKRNELSILDVGLDLKYDNVSFIKPGTKSTIANINSFMIGLIFPFKDKEGKSSINIEPFWQYKQYVNYEKDATVNWGVKFALPFKQLF